MFRKAVAGLATPDDDLDVLRRRLRIGLSELGCVDFFVGDSQEWQVLPPVLAGCSTSGRAVLTGGRVPKLVEAVAAAAQGPGISLQTIERDMLPAEVAIDASEAELARIADAVGLPYVQDFASMVCSNAITPVLQMMEAAEVAEAPANWTVQSFDFSAEAWVDGYLPRAACRFTAKSGVRRHYVDSGRGGLRLMPAREALYAAAALQNKRLARYDRAEQVLSSPITAPFPESSARAACLCSGRSGRYAAGRWYYERVPLHVAAFILTSLGQGHPGVQWLPKKGRCR